MVVDSSYVVAICPSSDSYNANLHLLFQRKNREVPPASINDDPFINGFSAWPVDPR